MILTTPNQLTPKQVLKSIEDDPFFQELNETRCDSKLKLLLSLDNNILDIKRRVRILAKHNLPILILGETGTGKELIAEALHGERRGNFVPVNCSGIPSELLESEFFGSIKGAFTGAIDKIGYVKEAENGTLFLDEIGDMPGLLQSKVLRLLQSKKFRKVGSTNEEIANFRVVCATNRINLEEDVSFRKDLYFRISGHVIKLPSLQERGPEDIKLIVKSFCSNPAIQQKILDDILSGKKLSGNVRQLLNIIEEHNILFS